MNLLHQNNLLAGNIGYVVSGFAGRIAETVLVAQSSSDYCRHNFGSDIIVDGRCFVNHLLRLCRHAGIFACLETPEKRNRSSNMCHKCACLILFHEDKHSNVMGTNLTPRLIHMNESKCATVPVLPANGTASTDRRTTKRIQTQEMIANSPKPLI